MNDSFIPALLIKITKPVIKQANIAIFSLKIMHIHKAFTKIINNTLGIIGILLFNPNISDVHLTSKYTSKYNLIINIVETINCYILSSPKPLSTK